MLRNRTIDLRSERDFFLVLEHASHAEHGVTLRVGNRWHRRRWNQLFVDWVIVACRSQGLDVEPARLCRGRPALAPKGPWYLAVNGSPQPGELPAGLNQELEQLRAKRTTRKTFRVVSRNGSAVR
jgi:hypothetical protein